MDRKEFKARFTTTSKQREPGEDKKIVLSEEAHVMSSIWLTVLEEIKSLRVLLGR